MKMIRVTLDIVPVEFVGDQEGAEYDFVPVEVDDETVQLIRNHAESNIQDIMYLIGEASGVQLRCQSIASEVIDA